VNDLVVWAWALPSASGPAVLRRHWVNSGSAQVRATPATEARQAKEEVMARLCCILFICCSAGCIVIPEKSPHFQSRMVDKETSSAPLKIGRATREDVERSLGEPTYKTNDGRVTGYFFTTKVGRQIGILCGPCCMPWPGSIDKFAYDHVWLAYDDHGVLKTFEKGQSFYWEESKIAWAKFAERVGRDP